MNAEKLQMFVERYLELSSELKYRKGESGAFMQLGEILTQKGDFDQGTKHFYRAMKIAEETEDSDLREAAKVNYGMANASIKWGDHMSNILRNIAGSNQAIDRQEDEDEIMERENEDDEEQHVANAAASPSQWQNSCKREQEEQPIHTYYC